MVKKLLVLSFVTLTIQVQAESIQTRMDAAILSLIEQYGLQELPTIVGTLAQFSGQNLTTDQTQTLMTNVGQLETIIGDVAPELANCAELAAIATTIQTINTQEQAGSVDPATIILLVSQIDAFIQAAQQTLATKETNDPASAATIMQITDYINSLPHPVIISCAVGTVTLAAFILYYGYSKGWFSAVKAA